MRHRSLRYWGKAGAVIATAAISMILLNGLPMPYHPVFNVDRFANASRNKFFLCIESDDPQFDRHLTAGFLESLDPEDIAEVAR